jgi:hypothetical protein
MASFKKIKFVVHPPGADRIHYVNEDDIKTVIGRLPTETYSYLKEVHFNDESWGARTIGYINNDRRDISICALPPRVSLSVILIKSGNPRDYGAIRAKQWPHLAVRRFLLYNTFLHELGHMQIILPKAKTKRRKFAGERKADEFAKYWRKKLWKKLWAKPFDHPDPVHNPPTIDELLLAEKGEK